MQINYGVAGIVKSIQRFDGTTISNSYDVAARLTRVILPDSTNTFTYYNNALLKTTSNKTGTISNKYDNANRLTAEHQNQFASFAKFAVNYSLDPVGNPTNTTTTIDDTPILTTAYTFDAAERISEIVGQSEAFAFEYAAHNGLLSGASNTTSGIHASYQFDNMDRLTNIVWRKSSGSILRSFGYQYNNAGMITNITRETPSEDVAYTYDSLDRLTSYKKGTYTESYTWDLVGNLLGRIGTHK